MQHWTTCRRDQLRTRPRLCKNLDLREISHRSFSAIGTIVAELNERGRKSSSFWHLTRSSLVFTQPRPRLCKNSNFLAISCSSFFAIGTLVVQFNERGRKLSNFRHFTESSIVFTQPRPIADIHGLDPMLRCGPSNRTFAALAYSEHCWLSAVRDKVSFR